MRSDGVRLLPSEHVARDASLESYRRLADVFHDVLSEQTLDSLLDRIADTLAELVPYDTLTIYEADEGQGLLVPVLSRDQWADKILRTPARFGEGITGWAVEQREPVLSNRPHLDPRVKTVPGTPGDELRRRGGARARQRARPCAPRAPGADGLADRPLQPSVLPRAPAGGAHTRQPDP
jgi:hypothetical protein